MLKFTKIIRNKKVLEKLLFISKNKCDSIPPIFISWYYISSKYSVTCDTLKNNTSIASKMAIK